MYYQETDRECNLLHQQNKGEGLATFSLSQIMNLRTITLAPTLIILHAVLRLRQGDYRHQEGLLNWRWVWWGWKDILEGVMWETCISSKQTRKGTSETGKWPMWIHSSLKKQDICSLNGIGHVRKNWEQAPGKKSEVPQEGSVYHTKKLIARIDIQVIQWEAMMADFRGQKNRRKGIGE